MILSSVLHRKVSAVPDAEDPTLVLASDWNDTHDVRIYESLADTPPTTPSSYDDNFTATTIDAKWTTSAASGNTITATTTGIVFSGNSGQSAPRAMLMHQTIPLVDGSVVMAKLRTLDTTVNYSGVFCGPRNAAGAIDGLGIVAIDGLRHYRGAISSGGTISEEQNFGFATSPVIYVKFTFTSTGYTMHLSLDGNHWIPKFTRTYAGFLTTVTGFAIYAQANASAPNFCAEWFRVTI